MGAPSSPVKVGAVVNNKVDTFAPGVDPKSVPLKSIDAPAFRVSEAKRKIVEPPSSVGVIVILLLPEVEAIPTVKAPIVSKTSLLAPTKLKFPPFKVTAAVSAIRSFTIL